MFKRKPVKVRTIFMGTSEFADSILNSLIQAELNIISVYTKPDKRAGRKHEIKESAVKVTAKNNNIPIFQPDKLNDNTIDEIKKQKPDLILVAAYGKIIPKNVLEIPGFGVVNVHPSLLPKFRGPSPIQNAILNGETETGTTIMLMDEGIDTGDILNQDKVKIGKNETSHELSKRMAELSSGLLIEAINLWVEKKIIPEKQDNSKATLCQLIEKNDGKIIWSDEAESIYNRYRAFSSWPGIFTYIDDGGVFKRLKLNKISFLKNDPKVKHHLGEVFKIGDKVGVQTALGVIILEEVQLEGRENVKIEDFLNGSRDFIGSILK